MVNKRLNKNLSYEISKLDIKANSLPFRDFLIFRRKFCGMFVYRGKKSSSIKIFHYIVLNLKKMIKRKKINPMLIFFFLIKRVTPFLTLRPKKYKGNIIMVPSALFGNKKNLFLLNWIVRKVRRKSNIFGIKKEDVLKNLIDIYNLRGNVLKMKQKHNKDIMLARINLKNEGILFKKKVDSALQKESYLESKYDNWRKRIDRLNEELQLDNEEIEEELERWIDTEQEYNFIKGFKKILNRNKRKNEKFLNFYKKYLVK